ncbi:MAG: hypothetical protein JNK82_05605 [Myxococcaceae bacterium]|nr:hypothetical protein [Myxococcaceae bacterium]
MTPRGAKTTFVALVVMVAALIESPVHFSIPVLVAGAMLTALTIAVAATHEVSRLVRWVGLVTVGLLALTNIASSEVFGVPLLGVSVAGAATAAAIIWRGRSRDALGQWYHLVAAFALTAVTSAPATYLGNAIAVGDTNELAAGAYLFLFATAVLLATSCTRALHAAPAERTAPVGFAVPVRTHA